MSEEVVNVAETEQQASEVAYDERYAEIARQYGLTEFNPYHEPGGTSAGGQFTSGGGVGSVEGTSVTGNPTTWSGSTSLPVVPQKFPGEGRMHVVGKVAWTSGSIEVVPGSDVDTEDKVPGFESTGRFTIGMLGAQENQRNVVASVHEFKSQDGKYGYLLAIGVAKPYTQDNWVHHVVRNPAAKTRGLWPTPDDAQTALAAKLAKADLRHNKGEGWSTPTGGWGSKSHDVSPATRLANEQIAQAVRWGSLTPEEAARIPR